MVYKKLTVAMALVTLLSACGGGGSSNDNTNTNTDTGTNSGSNSSSSGSSESPTLKSYDRATLLTAFPGNKADAQLTETNIGPYLDSVLDNDSEFTGALALDRSATRASRASRSQSVYSATTTIPCESGKATVVASRDTKAGLATMDFTYSQCLQDGETLDGHQTVQYQGMFEDVQESSSDYTLSLDDFSITNQTGTERYKGTMQVTGEESCDQQVVYNLVMVSSEASQSMLADNLVIRDKCISVDDPNSVARNVSGDIYAGNTGRISVSSDGWQLADLDTAQGDNNLSPMAGSLAFKSGGSQVILTSWKDSDAYDELFSPGRSRLSFDHDGDGVAENQVALPSRYLLQEKMRDYRDRDGDGLFDGWEVANGSDPLKADATMDSDKDGVSNQLEFFRGSLPGKKEDAFSWFGNKPSLTVESGFSPAKQDAPYDLPIVITGSVPTNLANMFPRADLVMDLSALSGWELSASGSGCQLEANNSQLRCSAVDVTQFAGTAEKSVTIGSLHMVAKQVGEITLPVHWEKGFGFAVSQAEYPVFDVKATSLAYAATGASASKGYVLASLPASFDYPLQLAANGTGSPKTIRVTGHISNSNLRLTNLICGNGWFCEASPTDFSCLIGNSDTFDLTRALSLLTLRFAKPQAMGKSELQLTVTTDYGFTTRTIQQTRTLAFGQNTIGLQQSLQEAEQAGASEFVLPTGIYIGSLYNDTAHPLTIKGSDGSELWLNTLSSGKSHGLETDQLQGVTLHAEVPVLVKGAIKDSSLTLLNSAGTLDVAELSGSKVKVEGLGYTLFNGQRDLLVRNNLIQVEPAAANGVSDESANELFESGGEYPSPRQQVRFLNNTLVDVERISTDPAIADWQFSNNLLMLSGVSHMDKLLLEEFEELKPDHNLLPAAYQSLGGSNIYTDAPGVDAVNGYGLNADSPALDAGDSGADSGLTDLYGHTRIVGKAIDIGAVEKQ
jgi:hypothetical protein